jgi:hypothetical protein
MKKKMIELESYGSRDSSSIAIAITKKKDNQSLCDSERRMQNATLPIQ